MKRAIVILVSVILLLISMPLSVNASTLTYSITTNSDNCNLWYTGSQWGFTAGNDTILQVGRISESKYKMQCGLRFNNIQIPYGAIISNAYLTFTSLGTPNTLGLVNTIIQAENNPNPNTFSNYTDYFNRPRMARIFQWNDIIAWTTAEINYVSPNIAEVIQDVVIQQGWSQGNSLVLFWGDTNGISTQNNACRRAYSYQGGATKVVSLTVVFEGGSSNYSTINDTRLDTIITQLATLNSSISNVNKNYEALQASLNLINANIKTIPVSQIPTAQFEQINNSIKSQTSSINTILDSSNKLQTSINGLNTPISELNKNQLALKTSVDTVNASVKKIGSTSMVKPLLIIILVLGFIILIMLFSISRRL